MDIYSSRLPGVLCKYVHQCPETITAIKSTRLLDPNQLCNNNTKIAMSTVEPTRLTVNISNRSLKRPNSNKAPLTNHSDEDLSIRDQLSAVEFRHSTEEKRSSKAP